MDEGWFCRLRHALSYKLYLVNWIRFRCWTQRLPLAELRALKQLEPWDEAGEGGARLGVGEDPIHTAGVRK